LMAASNHKKIRLKLREVDDGMTVGELAGALGLSTESVRNSLKAMPDAYIDRWAKRGNAVASIWCAVHVPEDCPRPSSRRLM
jgi:predicted ArsR family transcriptional regulator